MPKNETGKTELKDKQTKDEKRKKELNTWGYYLAWIAFFSALGAAFVKLVDKWEIPKKNDFIK